MSDHSSTSRIHRGHRIVVVPFGAMWSAIVYAPHGGVVTPDIEDETAHGAMHRAMKLINERLDQAFAAK